MYFNLCSGKPHATRMLHYSKVILQMKLIALFILIACMHAGASVLAQPVTLSEKGASMQKVLREIRKQSNVDFIFKTNQISKTKPVTIQVKEQPLEEVLESIFSNQPVDYILDNKTIIIRDRVATNNPIARLETNVTQQTIQGTVTNADGDPMAGVSILEKGTRNGTFTDEQGQFTIVVSEQSAILVISYLGYVSREIAVSQLPPNIVLSESHTDLDEVIVVGYGTQRKSDLTGAISTIQPDELPKAASTSVEQMLAGKAAGMQVRANDAQPGGAMQILIRGAASTGAGNEPLYIIDGFPVTGGTDPSTGTRYGRGDRSPLNSINPNDIESIQVLKDASATAIYGARAANGVVLITTKSGKQGRARVDYDVRASTQNVLRPWDMMNASQLMQARNDYLYERYLFDNKIGVYGDTDPNTVDPFTPPHTDAEIASAGAGTNWIDEVTRKGNIQDHNLSISGATDRTNYLVSLSYFDQTGIVRGNDFNRITGRVNLTQEVNDWLTAGVRATGSKIAINNPALGTGIAENSGILESALKFTPSLPVRLENGEYSSVPNSVFFPNPVSLLEITNRNNQDRLMVQSFVEIEPMENLKIRSQFGFDQQSGINNSYLPTSTLYGAAVGGQANINQNNRFDKLFNTTINYRTLIGERHTLDALLGYEWQSMGTHGHSLSNNQFPTDAFLTDNIGTGESERPGVGSYRSVNELASYFGRVNYNYDDRYLVTFTMRADGSSRFGEGNRFGYFPSAAVAWRLDQEEFMQDISWLSNAKLRLSVGQTGNSNISGAYAFYSFGRNYLFGNSVNAGTYLSSYANPQLRWETTTEYNLGFDLGFLNNRINVTTELFSKEVSDLLGSRRLQSYLPLTSVAANLGVTSSKGWEVTVNTVNTTGAFQWSTDITASAYYDRWKERSPDVILRSYESVTDPLRVQWGYVLDGLVQPGEVIPHMPGAYPGVQKIKDINGFDANNNLTGEPDGIINDADVVKIANLDPSFIFGFNNTFNYRNFDLNVHIYGMLGIWRGNNILSLTTEVHPNVDRGWNLANRLDQFWSSQNQDAQYPNIYVANTFQGAAQQLFQRADFIRVRNITLGYSLPQNSFASKWLSNVRVYGDVTNPFLITKWTGVDPEFSGIYPPAKSFTLGLNVQF